ncbi:glycosyltransferase [Agromyces sp. MMS24-JH15]|uniref:glycosyltransferase n=1 Tax=Agromyces sp. MMS24-JH15 TaxID=3243765 RepID=UPI003748FA8E
MLNVTGHDGSVAGTTRRRILIVEPNSSGHRLYYVAELIEYALSINLAPVLLTSRFVAGSEDYEVHLGRLHGTFSVVEAAGKITLRTASAFADDLDATAVIVPDGDRWALRLGLGVGRVQRPISVLIMRASVQPRNWPIITKVAQPVRIRIIRRAARRSKIAVTFLRPANWRGDSHDMIVRDPIQFRAPVDPDAREKIRSRMQFRANSRVVGVLGALDERKNVDLVLAAVSQLRIPNIVVLIAGRMSDIVRGQVGAAPPDLDMQIVDRLLSDQELDEAIVCCDVVVAAYSNESPSGIVGKALIAGTPIVAAGAAELRNMLVDAPNGRWVHLSIADLVNAIEEALRLPRSPNRDLEITRAMFARALIDPVLV